MDSEYMKIVNTIKEIASNVIANGEPMEVIVGEVVSESPLAMKRILFLQKTPANGLWR